MSLGITIKHHIDAGERDEEGYDDYYYEYDSYEFSLAGTRLLARSYTDEPQKASLGPIVANGGRSLLSHADFSSSLVRGAVNHLRREGKSEIVWIPPDPDPVTVYAPIPI